MCQHSFFAIPSFNDNSQKINPYYGFSHPLNAATDDSKEYVFVWYTSNIYTHERYWTVIDDQKVIRKYKQTFVVYLSEASLRDGVGRAFIIFEDGKQYMNADLAYFPHCTIYDDFFRPYEKTFSIEEMEQYAIEHNLQKDDWIW